MTNEIKYIEIEIIIDNEIVSFICEQTGEQVFESKEHIKIEAVVSKEGICLDGKLEIVDEKLQNYHEAILECFISKYNKIVNRYFESLEDGVEPISDNNIEPEIKVPYDPNSIRVTQARFSLKEIYEMINGTDSDEAILDISPDFQRNFVWDYTRKARLIESIMLKIPLPVFYLSRDNDGKFQVVDGVQRLSVVNEFFSNKFRLKNLEYLNSECEGCYMQKQNSKSLHPKFFRTLRSYQIDCNVIEPDTPYKVKLDIFKRLNTGGRSLNRQEIRHSIMKPEIRAFVKELSESKSFVSATVNSIKPIRMMDQELVIRYIGFYLIYNLTMNEHKLQYNGKMDDFLDDVVNLMNIENKQFPFKQLKNDFIKSMNNAKLLFGSYAFRKVTSKYRIESRNMINKSLFTSFSVLLTRYDESIINEKSVLTDKFASLLEKNVYLYDSITYATNDKARIDTAFLEIEEFLKLNLR